MSIAEKYGHGKIMLNLTAAILLCTAMLLLSGCAAQDTQQAADNSSAAAYTAEQPVIYSRGELLVMLEDMLLQTSPRLEVVLADDLSDITSAELSALMTEAANVSVLARTLTVGQTWQLRRHPQTGEQYASVSVTYAAPVSYVKQMKTELAARAAAWAAGVSACSAAETVLLAHDSLVYHCTYAETDSLLSHSAYGALMSGTAVCEGYAEAFQLCMESAGIPSCIVTGTAQRTPDGAPAAHAWNLVMLDGCWYHVDCTWDDAEDTHAYFLCTDTEMQAHHTWERGDYPAAEGSAWRYETIAAAMQ